MARIGLAQLPLKLAGFTGAPALPYRKIYDAAVTGRFPAEFENGRWSTDDVHLPAVAAAFNLTPRAEAPQLPGRARRVPGTAQAAA